MDSIPVVKATNITNFRKNLKSMLDKVTSEHSTMIVTRTDSEDVVVMSESEYEMIIKEINDLRYHMKLVKSINQIKEGKLRTVTLDELEELE